MSEAGASGARLTDAQRLDWLRLIRSESIGPKTFRVLVNRYGGAGAALDALPSLAAQRGRAIRVATREECEKELDATAKIGARLISVGESDYPPALRAIEAPPPLICVRGDLAVLQRPMVAIIGSRNSSAAGLAFCERLTRDLGAAGFVVASGLARGVDARAHRSSLGTGTVAVFAGGLDRLYPADHAELAEDILERGAWISEMPMGWEPRGRDFPRRNRIVSGLSLGVVVIEAARRSGSLITARFASEQGREIFAVPGSPLDPRSEGTNGLLREGATLCTRGSDVIDALAPLVERGLPDANLEEDVRAEPTEPLWDELDLVYAGDTPRTEGGHEMDEPPAPPPRESPEPKASLRDPRAEIESLLGPTPMAVDDLARAALLPVADVRVVLLDLELSGRLERHGGGLVSMTPRRLE
jgi:DNA processing protein